MSIRASLMLRSVAGARHAGIGVRARLPGRPARSREGRRRRHPRRRSHAHQRADQHQAVDRHQRRGEYVFANVDPGNYTVKAALQGYKTIDRGGIRIGTQQFLTLDLTMEVGAIDETSRSPAQAPLIETVERLAGHARSTRAALQTLPSPGRTAFMIGARCRPSSRRATRSSTASRIRPTPRCCRSAAARAAATTTCSTACRSPTCATAAAATRPSKRSTTSRCRCTPTTRRWAAPAAACSTSTLKSGTNSFHGTGFFQTRPIWGQTNNYFSQIASARRVGDTARRTPSRTARTTCGGGGFGGPIVKNRTFFWFATESYNDVQTRNVLDAMPTAAERTGDFSG